MLVLRLPWLTSFFLGFFNFFFLLILLWGIGLFVGDLVFFFFLNLGKIVFLVLLINMDFSLEFRVDFRGYLYLFLCFIS